MFAGNLWILARSWLHARRRRIPRKPIARAGEIPVGGVKLFEYPGRATMHSGAHRRGRLRCLQPEMHASFLRRLLFARERPARMPCHEGYFSIRRWIRAAGSAARARCRASCSNGRAPI